MNIKSEKLIDSNVSNSNMGLVKNDSLQMETDMDNVPYIHVDRKRINIRPLKTLYHFRKLIANKEDTEQVFHISNNLRDGRYISKALEFLKSPKGEELFARNEFLPDILDDHDTLLAMPVGTLGRTYAEFMEREKISAHGLVEENEKFSSKIPSYDDRIEWFYNRMRDTHDMAHILTGYGRDPLGEQCVLAFTYSQNLSLAFLFIAYGGGIEVKRRAPSHTPVFKAIRQAQRNGKIAANIGYQDITALLPLQLEEVRAMLNITQPTRYNLAHEVYKSEGIDPHEILAIA